MQIIWRDADAANPSIYEAARTRGVFNKRHPRKFPLAIIKASSDADVVAAVQLAITHNARVAVRAGGHSFPVWSLQDDAVLIDLGEWRECVVDAPKGIASVTPGVTSQEINEVLVSLGLMFPAGHCGDVGLGGFLLQGGMGWNCGNWGWACERVDAVEVVTAQAQRLLCNAEQNSELYWAAKGAGPAFPGVVTRFHLRVLPYYSDGVRSSGYIYPARLYRPVFNWVLSTVPDLDRDTEITALSQFRNGELCFSILLVCMKETAAQAADALQPLHETRPTGALTEWFCQEDSLANLYREKAKSNPPDRRWCSANTYLEDKHDVVSILEEGFLTLPSPDSYAFWCPIAPTSKRKLPDMAFSMQSDHYFAVYTGWKDEADDGRCQSWLQLVMDKIKAYGVGAYIGDSDFSVRPDRYWAKDNEGRLREIRRRWDPDSRFCGFP
ncbi:6-hydroxy-D-nicotine oxidase [Aspergillus udagawae]|nr:6-hydroxy-D-nicotine oxidase [Aspergillus udagawae]